MLVTAAIILVIILFGCLMKPLKPSEPAAKVAFRMFMYLFGQN